MCVVKTLTTKHRRTQMSNELNYKLVILHGEPYTKERVAEAAELGLVGELNRAYGLSTVLDLLTEMLSEEPDSTYLKLQYRPSCWLPDVTVYYSDDEDREPVIVVHYAACA